MSKTNLGILRQVSGVSENAVIKVLSALDDFTSEEQQGIIRTAVETLRANTPTLQEAVDEGSKELIPVDQKAPTATASKETKSEKASLTTGGSSVPNPSTSKPAKTE